MLRGIGTEAAGPSKAGSAPGLVGRYLTAATLVRLVPIGVVLLTGLALTIWTHRLLSAHRDLVVHTHEVIEMAKDVLIGLDDAETGQRGYLITADPHDLEPYRRARRRLGTMPTPSRRRWPTTPVTPNTRHNCSV